MYTLININKVDILLIINYIKIIRRIFINLNNITYLRRLSYIF